MFKEIVAGTFIVLALHQGTACPAYLPGECRVPGKSINEASKNIARGEHLPTKIPRAACPAHLSGACRMPGKPVDFY
ncbi:hypothetical protein K8S19_00840 [bacterium]|nr:hypothetical protein [bacterium]